MALEFLVSKLVLDLELDVELVLGLAMVWGKELHKMRTRDTQMLEILSVVLEASFLSK